MPGSIGQKEEGVVKLISEELGQWVYNVSGSGTEPGVMEETLEVITVAGTQASSSIAFRNALPKPLQLHLELVVDSAGDSDSDGSDSEKEEEDEFADETKDFDIDSNPGLTSSNRPPFVLLRKADNLVPSHSTMQVPLAFSPSRIMECRARLIITAPEDGLQWIYPLRGISEAPIAEKQLEFKCPAREQSSETFELTLPGLPAKLSQEERFSATIGCKEEYRTLVDRYASLTTLTQNGFLESRDQPLRLRLDMEPLKPFEVPAEIVVKKSSGGRWRFPVLLVATDAEPDDVITIESSLNRTASVSFQLSNQFLDYADFKAYFTLESAPEFQVHPSEGTLPPYGSPGAEFTVSFTPREYGKLLSGKLIIETADMQWSYVIKGTHPEYRAPLGQSKVDNKIDVRVASALAKSSSVRRNIMKDNMNVGGSGGTARARSRGVGSTGRRSNK
ncbi:CFAP47 [Symbiodinium sp. KB8]|nr:CFAP47 [Symbiodinium sp. KB8]